MSTQNDEKQEQHAVEAVEQTVAASLAPATLEIDEVGDQGALCPVQTAEEGLVPMRPKHVDAAMEEEIGKKAYEFLEMVRTDPNDIRIGDVIFNLGQEVLTQNNTHVDLYNEHMGKVLAGVTDESSPFKGDILAIKQQIDLVNPAVLSKVKIKDKIGRFFKKTVMRLPNGAEVLRMVAENRETVNSTVSGLRKNLHAHENQIIMDSQQLIVICEDMKTVQLPLQEEIYLGQLQWKLLSDELLPTLSGLEKESAVLHLSDLVSSVTSLQQVDNINLQTRYGGALLVRNSRNVRRVIRSTNTLVGSVAGVLAVRLAAVRQVQIQEMAKAIQDGVYETLEDAAKQTGKAVVKSAQMNMEMVEGMKRLEDSCQHFDFAAKALTEVCSETIKVGAMVSNKLNVMNESLQARADAAHAAIERKG